MSKNTKMLKTFIKVIKGKKEEINLIIPDMYAANIYEIDYKLLKKKGLTNLIFDIDNTILKVNSLEVSEKLKKHFKYLDKKGFNICILSNNNKERVIPVAKELQTGYIFKAQKPNKTAFERALVSLNSKRENTAMIGDQMLSDVKGAKENKIYSILVEPVSNKYDLKTGTSRVLQNIMMKKLNKTKDFKRYDFY